MQRNSLLLYISFHLDAFHLPGDRLSRVWGMQRPQWAQWTKHCSDILCDLLSTSTTAEAKCSKRPSSCSLLGPTILRMLQLFSTEFLFQWTRVALCPKTHDIRGHKTQDRTTSFWVKDDSEYIKIKVTEALFENSQGALLSRTVGTAQNQAWPSKKKGPFYNYQEEPATVHKTNPSSVALLLPRIFSALFPPLSTFFPDSTEEKPKWMTHHFTSELHKHRNFKYHWIPMNCRKSPKAQGFVVYSLI